MMVTTIMRTMPKVITHDFAAAQILWAELTLACVLTYDIE
jgi:hypothetical protein